MNPEQIGQQAAIASQVGLLNWIVVAVMFFCGSLVFLVMYQNSKREERYAKLVEKDIIGLGEKMDSYKDLVKEKMSGIEEANRAQKVEHKTMLDSLQKVSETLVNLAAITNAFAMNYREPNNKGG